MRFCTLLAGHYLRNERVTTSRGIEGAHVEPPQLIA